MDISRYQVTVDAGDGTNEDLATVLNDAAWVLDGASGFSDVQVTQSETDARWYVDELDRYLQERVNNFGQSIGSILQGGVITLSKKYASLAADTEVPSHGEPSAAIAVTRWNNETVQIYVLGDCTVVVELDNGDHKVIKHEQTKLQELEKIAEKEMVELVEDLGLSHEEAIEKIRPQLLKNRQQKNSTDGYWILGFEPEALNYGVYIEIPIKKINGIHLFTDGFARVIETFEIFSSYYDCFEFIDEQGTNTLFDILRRVEKEDTTCIDYPRIKTFDDAGLISLTTKR